MPSPKERLELIRKAATENLLQISLDEFGETFKQISGLFSDLDFQMGDIDIVTNTDNKLVITAFSKHFLFHSSIFKNNSVDIEAEFSINNNTLDVVAICKTKTPGKLSKLPGIIGDLLKPLNFISIDDLVYIITTKDLSVIKSQKFPEYNDKAVKFTAGINLAGFVDLNSSGAIGQLIVKPISPVVGNGPFFMSWNMRDTKNVSFDLQLPKDINIESIFKIQQPKLILRPVFPPQISIDGVINLKLPAVSVVVDGGFSYSAEGIRGTFKLDEVAEKLPPPLMYPGLHLSTLTLMIGISKTQGPVIGAEGNFYIGPDKPPAKISTGEFGLNSNQYKFIFSGTAGGVNPVFMYMYLDRLTFEDYLMMLTNKSVSLPAFLKSISIHQAMLHWCEIPQGEPKPDGTLALPLFGLSGITDILGHKTFTELLVQASSDARGKLIADPINISNGLLKITGNGKGTPEKYKGSVKVKPGGMELSFDSSGKPAFFALSAEVEVLGLASAAVEGYIGESGLAAKMKAKVADIISNELFLDYRNPNYFEAKTVINAKVSGLEISLDKLGKLKLNTILQGNFQAKFEKDNYSNSMALKFEFLGIKFDLGTITVAIKDLKEIVKVLEKFIRDVIVKEFANNILLWLKAALEDVLELAGEKLEQVGKLLNDHFKKTLAESAKLLKDAGYKAKQIGEALHKGYKEGEQALAIALKNAGLLAEEVGEILKEIIQLPADKASEILKAAGYTAVEIGRTLKNVYKLGEQKIGEVLKTIGTTAAETVEVFRRVLKIGVKETGTIMKALGYEVNQVTAAFEKLKDDVTEVTNVITAVYKVPETAAEEILRTAGFPATEIVRRFPKPHVFGKVHVFGKLPRFGKL